MTAGWREVEVEELARRVAMGPFGSSIRVDTFVPDGVPVISGQHLNGVRLSEEKFKYVAVEHADRLRNSNAYRGDVVFTHAGNIGQVAVIPANSRFERYQLSQRQFKLTPHQGMADGEFLAYYFRSPKGQHDLLANASSTGVPSIARPVSYLRSLKVMLPPIEEQRAIASVLGALDDKMELNRRMSETLEALARAIFTSWFVDFDPVRAKAEGRQPVGMDAETASLFPDSFEDSPLGPIPSGWQLDNIHAVARVVYGFPFSSSEFGKSEGTPLIRIRDLATNSPDVRTLEVATRDVSVRPGDVIVGMDGEFRAHHWQGEPAVLNQRLSRFDPIEGASRVFVRATLMKPLADAERSKTGTTVIHLGKADIDQFRILVPPPGVLAAFRRATEPTLDRQIAAASESDALARTRDTILPKLVSGEVRLS